MARPPRGRKRTEPELEVTVRTVGGVFGDDKVTRVTRKKMTVTNHGAVELERELPEDAHTEMSELAERVVGLSVPEQAEAGYVADGGTTTIEITSSDGSSRIVLHAGDDAPQPVWDLLDGLDRARRDAAD